jgi:hypothetical protein
MSKSQLLKKDLKKCCCIFFFFSFWSSNPGSRLDPDPDSGIAVQGTIVAPGPIGPIGSASLKEKKKIVPGSCLSDIKTVPEVWEI